jgi:hypothetical protein
MMGDQMNEMGGTYSTKQKINTGECKRLVGKKLNGRKDQLEDSGETG